MQLITLLNLSGNSIVWLNGHQDLAIQLVDYLNNSTQSDKNRIAKDHLNEMMRNADYYNLVMEHYQNGNSSLTWFEDDNWLSNVDNFHLSLDNSPDQYDQLNDAEKALVLIYPVQASGLRLNVMPAMTMSDIMMGFAPDGMHDGRSDKKDAFRHAFFNAINIKTVLPVRNDETGNIVISTEDIVRAFADAHESDTPTQLALEKQMDDFNNNVGINAAVGTTNLSSWSNNAIANAIHNKLINGDLRYLFPLDHLDPSFERGPDGTENTSTGGIVHPPDPNPTKLIKTNL